MIFYFTATGNCMYIAKQFQENPISITQELKKNALIYEADSIGIVLWDYGDEILMIVRRFLDKLIFKTQYLYLIVTYGMRDIVVAEWRYYYGKVHHVNFDYAFTIRMVDN